METIYAVCLALVASTATLLSAILLAIIGTIYKNTPFVRFLCRGWDIYMSGAVWAVVLVVTNYTGTWTDGDDPQWQHSLTLYGLWLTTLPGFILYLEQLYKYCRLSYKTGNWTKAFPKSQKDKLSSTTIWCNCVWGDPIPLNFFWFGLFFAVVGLVLDSIMIWKSQTLSNWLGLSMDVVSVLWTVACELLTAHFDERRYAAIDVEDPNDADDEGDEQPLDHLHTA